MSPPLISVVIPMFNAKEHIILALNSVLIQTYKGRIEIIVVNDGSNDGCENLVKEFIIKNPQKNIKLISKNNGGVSSARNAGILESKGEWIALLDSDDEWLPGKLEEQLRLIKSNPEIAFLGSNVNNLTYPFFGKSRQPFFKINACEMIIKWYPSTPTILVKKSLLQKSGLFDDTKRHGEDCDLWLRCMIHADIFVLNKSLVETGHGKKSYGEKGLSADLSKMYQGELSIIDNSYQRQQITFTFYLFAYVWVTIKFVIRLFKVFIWKFKK